MKSPRRTAARSAWETASRSSGSVAAAASSTSTTSKRPDVSADVVRIRAKVVATTRASAMICPSALRRRRSCSACSSACPVARRRSSWSSWEDHSLSAAGSVRFARTSARSACSSSPAARRRDTAGIRGCSGPGGTRSGGPPRHAPGCLPTPANPELGPGRRRVRRSRPRIGRPRLAGLRRRRLARSRANRSRSRCAEVARLSSRCASAPGDGDPPIDGGDDVVAPGRRRLRPRVVDHADVIKYPGELL